MKMNHHLTQVSNVLIIGIGGAGLRAGIEAKMSGIDVTILGKREKSDSHTALAAGGVNAALGNIDFDDSWEQHFADTFIEGYGIGDPLIVEIMAKEAPENIVEIDNWGANFKKLDNGKLDQRYFGAHTYRRTCYSGDYTGRAILNTLIKKAEILKIPIYDNQYVSDLLIENNTCFGAMSFEKSSGERTVHLADAVILATGGHTKIWRRSSSRKDENTGDGYYLALKSGCSLTDMEMVQFHPTGMVLPEEIAGTLVTEAVRGEGGRLFNIQGKRFMENYDKERMELSTRDRVAIANYTEIIEGRGTKNGGIYLDISHKKKDFILDKLPRIYRQFIDKQMLDISQSPMEVAPTAHYSMGGICVEALEHSTEVNGLYAAGEVTGGLHGANRLGGNSLAEILIFGRRAGKAAAAYSINLKIHKRSKSVINSAHENLDKRIKKGNQIARPIQRRLSDLMWECCGVVRDRIRLENGLNELNNLKEITKDIDIRIDSEGCEDLIVALDIDASIISAEATMKSALAREESRGSHQRSDFVELDNSKNTNYISKLVSDQSINVSEKKITDVPEKLKAIINRTSKIKDLSDKLIE
tara:strand:+ start:188 stop:1942 length:1755 start_codon:yes stop_codon:yes gene_type:complete